MKSVLIIGMGRLGHHLCKNLAEMGNEVMIVDRDEESMQDILSVAMMAKVGDCTKEDVLRSLGVGNFDICFVCISSDFQSSLEITSLLKELGAAYVVSKANRDIQAKFLLRNGADEVIYPERDVAERAAIKYGSNKVFDYIEMAEGYSILEIPPMHGWIGKSIGQLAIRSRYHQRSLTPCRRQAGPSHTLPVSPGIRNTRSRCTSCSPGIRSFSHQPLLP